MSNETDRATTEAQRERAARYPRSTHAGITYLHGLLEDDIAALREAGLLCHTPTTYGSSYTSDVATRPFHCPNCPAEAQRVPPGVPPHSPSSCYCLCGVGKIADGDWPQIRSVGGVTGTWRAALALAGGVKR